jgi:hypothetical protein
MLVDFKAHFDTRYEAYKQQENPKKDDEDFMMDFLESLDKTRYGDFVCDTLNNISMRVMTEPVNVNEVYVLTNTRVTMKRGSNYIMWEQVEYLESRARARIAKERAKRARRRARRAAT